MMCMGINSQYLHAVSPHWIPFNHLSSYIFSSMDGERRAFFCILAVVNVRSVPFFSSRDAQRIEISLSSVLTS